MRIKEHQPLPPDPPKKGDFTPPPGRRERRAEQRKNPPPPKPPKEEMENNKSPRSHNHAEAFCHMVYQGTGTAGTITLSIWNSRDGVTPFTMFSKEFGIELQHRDWSRDVYDPNHKPRKGELIWTSYTMEQAIEVQSKRFHEFEKQLEELSKLTDEEIHSKYKWDARRGLKEIIEKGLDSWVAEHAQKLVDDGEPRLELVKEDWPGAETEMLNRPKTRFA